METAPLALKYARRFSMRRDPARVVAGVDAGDLGQPVDSRRSRPGWPARGTCPGGTSGRPTSPAPGRVGGNLVGGQVVARIVGGGE